MNEQAPTSALEAQLDAMLRRVTHDREQRCGEIRAAAKVLEQTILRSSRAEARASVRKAIAQERAHIAQGLREAQARSELETGRRAQLKAQALLEHMWTQIAGVLDARWRDSQHRRSWIGAAFRQADLLLSSRSWCIEYGEGWTSEERGRSEDLAGNRSTRAIAWRFEPGLSAGLRIRCEGVCLDATIGGLLARRADIEADFLAEYLSHE